MPVIRGRKTELDDALIEKIVANIPRAYFMKHVARLVDVHYHTLHTWMTTGRKEVATGESLQNFIYGKLYLAYKKKLSEAMVDLLDELKTCPKNYGAVVWILEHCYKKEFMTLPEDVLKTLDYVNKYIKPIVEKGVSIDGCTETKEVKPAID